MNSKILIAIYALVYLAREVAMEIDTSMEFSNIFRQVNMQKDTINNLQRRLDKLLEEQNMRNENANQNQNQGRGYCKCKSGPRGAPGPAGPRGPPGPPGPSGPPGQSAIPDDEQTCLVVVGKCPAGFMPNANYGDVLQPLRLVTEVPFYVCCRNLI